MRLDGAGWAAVDEILLALARAGFPVSLGDLRRIVAESDKNRFELTADASRIRARQGHSVTIDLEWPIADPPEFLYHGTVEDSVGAVMAEGLRPMKRLHVHLSPDFDTAHAVGARRGTPVILRIAAARMAADGHVFRISENGIWLTDHVPPGYIERLQLQ